jgi:hypothetical protein
VTNASGAPLTNVRLLYGTWAYRLGNLNAGERVAVGEELSPRKAKTIVTRDALEASRTEAAPIEGRVFDAAQATPIEILDLMMFYETAGGYAFAHLPNRYQAYCDLSRQLELGRAILVADGPQPGAELVDHGTGQVIGGEESDKAAVVYRVLLPVKRGNGPK